MMTIENDHFNCMKMVICKVTTIENHKGFGGILGGVGVHFGVSGGIRGVGGISGVLWGWQGL